MSILPLILVFDLLVARFILLMIYRSCSVHVTPFKFLVWKSSSSKVMSNYDQMFFRALLCCRNTFGSIDPCGQPSALTLSSPAWLVGLYSETLSSANGFTYGFVDGAVSQLKF